MREKIKALYEREMWRDFASEGEYLSCCGLSWVEGVKCVAAIPPKRVDVNYLSLSEEEKKEVGGYGGDITWANAPSRLLITGALGERNRSGMHKKLRREGWELLRTFTSRTTKRKLNLWFQR